MNNIQIGDEVSFKECYHHDFDSDESDIDDWNGAIVLQVSDELIKIQKRHFSEPSAAWKWIDKNAKILQCSNQLVKYMDLAIIAHGHIPPYPVYYYDKYNDQKYVIIAIPYDEDDCGIYSFNIDTKEYKQMASYPDGFEPEEAGLAIDSKNNELYIFSGTTKCFGIYNIANDEFEIINKCDIPALGYPPSVYVTSTDELYFEGDIKDNFGIMKYSKKSGLCRDITANFYYFINKEVKYSRMVYDKVKERIMLFGGWTRWHGNTIYYDDIWIYDIHQNDDEGKWQPYTLKMPYKQFIKHAIFAFDSLVFVIYCEKEQNEIWCLELKSCQWFKSHLYFPRELAQCDIILVDNYHVHCMNYQDIHVRLDLHDVIPQELFRFYSKYYLKMICGYIRITFEEQYNIHVSYDLKQLISTYFNVLL